MHQGIADLSLHHFTKHEAIRLLQEEGFRVVEVLPVGLGPAGTLPRGRWFEWMRLMVFDCGGEGVRGEWFVQQIELGGRWLAIGHSHTCFVSRLPQIFQSVFSFPRLHAALNLVDFLHCVEHR